MKHTIEEFYKFANRIAKRDHWFIGGFLGAVYEEWKEKHSNKKKRITRKRGRA
jgi:hypothetical protein